MITNEVISTIYESCKKSGNGFFDGVDDELLRDVLEFIDLSEIEKIKDIFHLSDDSLKNIFISAFVVGFIMPVASDTKTFEIGEKTVDYYTKDVFSYDELKTLVNSLFTFNEDTKENVFDSLFVYVLPQGRKKFTFYEVVALFFKFGILMRYIMFLNSTEEGGEEEK